MKSILIGGLGAILMAGAGFGVYELVHHSQGRGPVAPPPVPVAAVALPSVPGLPPWLQGVAGAIAPAATAIGGVVQGLLSGGGF